jgi:DNA mismatch endonuclease (patch repair protein)
MEPPGRDERILGGPSADTDDARTAITLGGMPDHLSREGRSRVMSTIRSRDTKPELALRAALRSLGISGWRCHHKGLPGKPDLAFTRWKLAVFVDGAFWHGHPDHFTFGKSGEYWDRKIARTQERDRLADEALRADGWTVLRFWDFEVRDDPLACASCVVGLLVEAGRPTPSSGVLSDGVLSS